MQSKKEAKIAEKMKKLKDEKRQLAKDKNLALGVEISKAISAGSLELEFILDAINQTTKSKKNRVLLGLDQRENKIENSLPAKPSFD